MTGSKYQTFIESSSVNGANAPFIEAYYEQFLDDPESVSADWRAYFRLVQDQNAPRETAHAAVDPQAAKQACALRLINYYRVRGHQAARLDPLGLAPIPKIDDLDMAFHGLSEADFDSVFNTGTLAADDHMPLRDIVRIIKSVYTDPVCADYMHITETEQK